MLTILKRRWSEKITKPCILTIWKIKAILGKLHMSSMVALSSLARYLNMIQIAEKIMILREIWHIARQSHACSVWYTGAQSHLKIADSAVFWGLSTSISDFKFQYLRNQGFDFDNWYFHFRRISSSPSDKMRMYFNILTLRQWNARWKRWNIYKLALTSFLDVLYGIKRDPIISIDRSSFSTATCLMLLYTIYHSWRSGDCYLNRGECDLSQSKDDSFVKGVAKNNNWNNGDRHKIHEIFLIVLFSL